jgi:hypothetical protein
MTDDQLKQLIESNAKSIAALSDAMATEQEGDRGRSRTTSRTSQAISIFWAELRRHNPIFTKFRPDCYHQLAVLSERQIRTEEQIVKILKHLSITE